MEVEISRKFLDFSKYWPVTLVADNSHVVHLDVEGRAPNWALEACLITSYATTDRAPRKRRCGKPERKVVKAPSRRQIEDLGQVRVKGRSDGKFQNDLSSFIPQRVHRV